MSATVTGLLAQRLSQHLSPNLSPVTNILAQFALKEGLEKGLVEGLEKGILQNAREAILDVLDTRFGQVPDSVRERVNALDSERTLKALLRRAARASSLEEFQATL